MRIAFVEVQNFRKLKSVRIDFSSKTTLFVGANNSGKTSAMVALRQFLVERKSFSTNDFTLSNWIAINEIGSAWLEEAGGHEAKDRDLAKWEKLLPALDVWLDVKENEVHYVRHLLPTLDWTKGILGVRLRLEPKSIENLYKEFIAAATAARDAKEAAKNPQDESSKITVNLWPCSLRDFLDRRLKGHFEVRGYILDQDKCKLPESGKANPQPISMDSDPLDGDPFKGLIRINQINAQRGFSDASGFADAEDDINSSDEKPRLSGQLRSYYARHLDPFDMPEASDLAALQAIEDAQSLFDERLKTGFGPSLQEVEALGYPGVTDPRITIATRIRPTDGLNHSAAVQYEVVQQLDGKSLRLPEEYNGLGYQNLISMVFRLMSFRDSWMKVGKASKRPVEEGESLDHAPLHLVLIEEPEAHLHAQVQQVFINKAYAILRKHDQLGDKETLCTQLVVSTHSSHIAHECEFKDLRYFRRLPCEEGGKAPTTTVENLSEVFGTGDETEKFVTRYLKATHCDLFFADAAILVEGAAERMLVPHFIQAQFEGLSQAYISILEIGGSHAHRFRPLVDKLGLTTLIITDLDAVDPKANRQSRQPVRGQGLVTGNATLEKWIPEKCSLDDLLSLTADKKEKKHSLSNGVRVAYQIPIKAVLAENGQEEEALSNTFEDAFAYENLKLLKSLVGTGLIKKFKDAISAKTTSAELGAELFQILKECKSKAEFSLELLFLQDPQALKIPTYIKEGLEWLGAELKKKQEEILSQGTGLTAKAECNK